jgi:hypothetical protein
VVELHQDCDNCVENHFNRLHRIVAFHPNFGLLS